jgi:DNA helicase-2/ATP-dependent DNA helicase PcrA
VLVDYLKKMKRMELNEEKLEILKYDGNTLVIANPGTGKTQLLAYKYAQLLKSGIAPSDILCLTFTKKATNEMEERIIKILKEEGLKIDYSDLNVYTFHAYACEQIGIEETIPTNLLRYSIYKYIKEKEIFRYGDEYLIEEIVPKLENLIRYLKSFSILPDQIDLKKVKVNLPEINRISKEELEKYAEEFVKIYQYYEEIKKNKGIDYADMLLEFRKLKNKKKFKYVLIDELQDVNEIEAQIALDSGEKFFAVGDKKQAIFGFQGGSILNFEKFKNSKIFVLSQNFRSANTILEYAKEYFISKTKEEQHKNEVKELKNPNKKDGSKPIIYRVSQDENYKAVCELIKNLKKENKKIAILVRTNHQILKISKELEKNGIEYSSTYFEASDEAKKHIINFLKGILSNNIEDIRNSMFSTFFPCAIQEVFELAELNELTLDKIYEKCPEFKNIRQTIKTTKDVDRLFEKQILPIALTYGKEYYLGAITIWEAFKEAVLNLEQINFRELINYLKSAENLVEEPEIEKEIILTTVHKAKGRQFDIVVYVPKAIRDKNNFQDEVVKTILRTKGINAEEELNEESLRIDFVAITRAKDQLHIIPQRVEDFFINNFSEIAEIKTSQIETFEKTQRLKKAYNLFVSNIFLNNDFEKVKKLLADKNTWLVGYIKKHFQALDKISFSFITSDPKEYLIYNILQIRETSFEQQLGSKVHSIASAIIKNLDFKVDEKTQPYKENICNLLLEIRKDYPQIVGCEKRIRVPLNQMLEIKEEDIKFEGRIDAIFKNKENYLIVDWKTDKSDDRGAEHRQQLEVYKRAFAISNNIELNKIKIAIGYVGLKPIINIGKINYRLDTTQPKKSSFQTFTKNVNKILEWKNDPELFIKELLEKNSDDLICKILKEEYEKEV